VDALHLPQSKKNAQAEAAVIVYEDEASFRQSPTIHQTWAPRNCRPEIPTRGERHTQKILGAVALRPARFAWRHQTDYFNHLTYLSFVDEVLLPSFYRRGHRVFLIQDNASYHTHPEVTAWFGKQHRRLAVFGLPKYSPDFNAQERLWHYTRKEGTHNRYFATSAELCASLFTTFKDIQRHPEKIHGLLEPFL